MTTDKVSSLFVCYAEPDRAWVQGYLRTALDVPNIRLTTRDDFLPGDTLLTAFENAIATHDYTILVMSPAFLADEIVAFATDLATYQRVTHPERRVIPLQLKAADIRLALNVLVRLDYTDQANWERETVKLRQVLNAPAPPPAAKPDCPYPGMKPFKHAAHFYGREPEIAKLVQRVRDQPQTFVIGASGCGKSSLVFAGLIPALSTAQPGRWITVTLRPGDTPLRALHEQLKLTADTALPPADYQVAVNTLLGEPPSAEKLLVVVDQFEECFIQTTPDQQKSFFEALNRLAELAQCAQVFTLRSDFYGEFQASSLASTSEGQIFDLLPLRDAALRAAVTRPAQDVGVYVDEILVERLIRDADAVHSPGYLPMLQETMIRLWDSLVNRWLPLSSYEALGENGKSGLAVAIALKADATLDAMRREIAPEAVTIAQRVFLRLTLFADEPTLIARRQQALDQLRGEHDDPAIFDRTLRYLTDNRLLTTDDDDPTIVKNSGKIVNISHEMLIEQWPTFQMWVKTRREAELMRLGLLRDARDWQQHPNDTSFLYSGQRLKTANDWLQANSDDGSPAIRSFLTASATAEADAIRAQAEAHQQREQAETERKQAKHTRNLVLGGVMVIALAVIAVLGGRTIRLEGLRQQAIALNPLTPIAASGAPPTLFMDKYEVSNQQYQLCLDAGGAGCTKPDVALGAPDHPVSSVTPYQAAAFCRWVGQRLPSRDEWLLAAIALGTASERRWSWGDNPPTADLANVGLKEPMPTDTVSVSDDFYRTSDTPDGLRHMVGNVREWTTTIDPATCPAGTTCPANWDGTSTLPQDVKLYALGFSFRSVVYPESPPKDDQASFIGTFDHVGFRCASG